MSRIHNTGLSIIHLLTFWVPFDDVPGLRVYYLGIFLKLKRECLQVGYILIESHNNKHFKLTYGVFNSWTKGD
jgi:hypothetical protein